MSAESRVLARIFADHAAKRPWIAIVPLPLTLMFLVLEYGNAQTGQLAKSAPVKSGEVTQVYNASSLPFRHDWWAQVAGGEQPVEVKLLYSESRMLEPGSTLNYIEVRPSQFLSETEANRLASSVRFATSGIGVNDSMIIFAIIILMQFGWLFFGKQLVAWSDSVEAERLAKIEADQQKSETASPS